MSGSLDDKKVKVLGRDDYQFVVIRQSWAEIWVSPIATMSRPEIAAELRRLADFVESTT